MDLTLVYEYRVTAEGAWIIDAYLKGSEAFAIGGFTLSPEFTYQNELHTDVDVDDVSGGPGFFTDYNPETLVTSGFSSNSQSSNQRDGLDGQWLLIASYSLSAEPEYSIQTSTATREGDFFLSSGASIAVGVEDITLWTRVGNSSGNISISGIAQQNSELQIASTLEDPDGLGDLVITWQRSTNAGGAWEAIPGSQGNSYTPSQEDVGYYLRAEVRYIDGAGSSVIIVSYPTLAIVNIDDPASGSLSISGTPQEGSTLTASLDNLIDPDGPATTAFQWQQYISGSWIDITGSTSDSLSIPSDQTYVGKTIRVVATTTDSS
jgi:hypothetical protein